MPDHANPPNTWQDALRLSVCAALSAALAVGLAHLFKLEFPLYALISAVLVTDVSGPQMRKLALPRLAGTVLGTTLGAVTNSFLPPSAWSVGLGTLSAMFLCHLLRLQDAIKVAGYVCGIVLLNHGDHPWEYALFRTLETLLGIGAAILVSFLPRLVRLDKPGKTSRVALRE